MNPAPSIASVFMMSSKVYDRAKWLAQYGLPALATLYFALSNLWGWGYAEQVIGTITSIDIFLGLILGLSTKAYNASPSKFDGQLVVEEDERVETYRLEMAGPLTDLKDKTELKLKVAAPLVSPPSQE